MPHISLFSAYTFFLKGYLSLLLVSKDGVIISVGVVTVRACKWLGRRGKDSDIEVKVSRTGSNKLRS